MTSAYEKLKDRSKQREEVAKAERAARADKPFRYFLSKGDTNKEIIICDVEPTFLFEEHTYKNAKGNFEQVACTRESHGHCPCCESTGKDPYHALALTVIDLRPYTPKKEGAEEIPFTRRLIIVKGQQHEKWFRKIDAAMKVSPNGTLRGAVFALHRSDNKNSPATGDDMDFIEFEDLDDGSGNFIHEYLDAENKPKSIDCAEVFDYEKVLAEMPIGDMEVLFNVAPPAGSDRANAAASSKGRGNNAASCRGRGRQGTVQEDPQEPAEKPSRGRGRGRGNTKVDTEATQGDQKEWDYENERNEQQVDQDPPKDEKKAPRSRARRTRPSN